MIAIKIRGKITMLGELRSGISQRGNNWKNIQFVIKADPQDAQTDMALCSARDECAQHVHDMVKFDEYGISVDTYDAMGYLKVESFTSKAGNLIHRNEVECWSVTKVEK